MSRNDMQPLRAAVKAALRGARSMHSKPGAGSVALLALSAAAWVPQAMAVNYTAGNATQLRNAIIAANSDGAPSSTITLTASFTTPNTALPLPTKPMTIDTQGFVLSGISTAARQHLLPRRFFHRS